MSRTINQSELRGSFPVVDPALTPPPTPYMYDFFSYRNMSKYIKMYTYYFVRTLKLQGIMPLGPLQGFSLDPLGVSRKSPDCNPLLPPPFQISKNTSYEGDKSFRGKWQKFRVWPWHTLKITPPDNIHVSNSHQLFEQAYLIECISTNSMFVYFITVMTHSNFYIHPLQD